MKNNNTKQHSEPIQEIMSQIPGWTVRWGMTIIFSIILALLMGSYLIKVPEMITIPVKVNSNNSNSYIYSNVNGHIDSLFVKKGDTIIAGQKIAVIQQNLTSNRPTLKALLPAEKLNSIKPGQKANIKISEYPSKDYGMLTGSIHSVLLDDNNYIAEISLTQGNITNFGNKIDLQQNMSGYANIITREVRLIEKFINPIKARAKSLNIVNQ